MELTKPFYIAADTSSFEEFKSLIDELATTGCGFKVGMQAFYGLGEKTLDYLKERELPVFLDLKLHDIPNTVSQGIYNLVKRYKPELINIHSSGGFEMMRRTVEAIKELDVQTKLIGVTVLTSLDQEDIENTWKTHLSIDDHVMNLAKLSKEAGLDGIVCSCHESKKVKAELPSFLTITPGIRLNSSTNDQKRVVTPKQAKENLADYLVIGRGITASENREQALLEYWENYCE